MPILIFFIVLFVIVLVVLIWGIAVYNSLVTLRNRFKNAFAQIDVQLKRRYNLIPNMVEVAKGHSGCRQKVRLWRRDKWLQPDRLWHSRHIGCKASS